MGEHVCPPWLSFLLTNAFRRMAHDPSRILGQRKNAGLSLDVGRGIDGEIEYPGLRHGDDDNSRVDRHSASQKSFSRDISLLRRQNPFKMKNCPRLRLPEIHEIPAPAARQIASDYIRCVGGKNLPRGKPRICRNLDSIVFAQDWRRRTRQHRPPLVRQDGLGYEFP